MESPLDTGPVVLTEDADVIDDVAEVVLGDLALEEGRLAVGEARLRPPAEVHDDLDQVGWIGQSLDGIEHVRRKRLEKQPQVVDRLSLAMRHARFNHVFSCHMQLAYRRNERGFRDSHDGLFHEELDGVEIHKAGLFEASIYGRLIGSNRRQDAIVGAAAALTYPGLQEPQTKTDERRDIGLRPGQDLEVMRLLLPGYTELEKAPQLAGAVFGSELGVGLHFREAQDRGQARPRNL